MQLDYNLLMHSWWQTDFTSSPDYAQVTLMAGNIVMEGQAEIAEYETLLRSVMYSMSGFTCPISRQLQVNVYSGNRYVNVSLCHS